MSPQLRWNRKHRTFMKKYKRKYYREHKAKYDAKNHKYQKKVYHIYHLYQEGRLKLVK